MSATPVTPANTPFVGSQRITSLSSSTALTVPAGARWCILKPRTQAIHVDLNGTATTADMLIDVGQSLEITTRLSDVRIIEAAASASVDVWYFG